MGGGDGTLIVFIMERESRMVLQRELDRLSILYGQLPLLNLGLFTTILQMDNCQLSMAGVVTIAHILGAPTSVLKKLSVIKNDIPIDGAWIMALALKQNKSLEELDVSSNAFGHSGARMLAEALVVNKKVHTLTMCGLSLSDLSIFVPLTKQMLSLDISFNTRHTNSLALAASLVLNKSLQELYLSNMGLSDQTGQALFSVQQAMPCLTILNLEGNNFSATAMNCLVMWLKSATCLKRLFLSNTTGIMDDGRFLVEALLFNRSITDLSCAGIMFNARSMFLLIERGWKWLEMSTNQFSNVTWELFCENLSVNSLLVEFVLLGVMHQSYWTLLMHALETNIGLEVFVTPSQEMLNIEVVQTLLAVNSRFYHYNNMDLPELKRNYNHRFHFWTPSCHSVFLNHWHCRIFIILLASQRFSIMLPNELWLLIFTYFRFRDR